MGRGRKRGALAAIATASALAPACSSPRAAPAPMVLQSGDIAVSVRLDDGTFDVARGGSTVVSRATADVLLDDGSGARLVSMRDACARSVAADGSIVCDTGGVELRLHLDLADPAVAGRSYLTARLDVSNTGASPVTLLRISPLVVTPDAGGAVFLGADPSHHRILENGRFVAFDQTAQLVTGDPPPFALSFALGIPIRGASASNWSHAIADLDDPSRSLVAGWFTFDHAATVIGIAHDPDSARHDDAGHESFTTYAAESVLEFHGKRVAPGDSFSSETFAFDPLPPDPLEALEHYASELARTRGITPWTKRGGAGREVPTGWNSWTGSDSTGGYGTAIDDATIAANMDAFRREIQPFGATYFQIDDGWENAVGDWQWNAKRFPAGGAATAASIAAAGFKPGLWISPFVAAPGSQLAAQHPDWLMPVEDGVVAAAGKDRQTIDLSNPAVRAFVHQTFADFKAAGWKWAKVDFTYLALLGKPQFDPSLTNIEAWRAGWKEIRDALGPDVFLVGIGFLGPNVGVVDGMRTTLDSAPRWDESSADDYVATTNALKGTVRTASRRWFYQNRVWLNHHDMIFFRSWPDASVPPLSIDEATTFASWIGMSGSIFKVGDKLVDVEKHPEWIDVLRRLYPVWPDAARPVDVLVRDYPETFRQHVRAAAGEWDNVGLFNWGTNRDWSRTPPAAMGEQTRSYAVPCEESECLAYEFWSEQYLGRFSGSLTVQVDPRRAKVLALRAPRDVPQLLGTNRHVTQGATDLGPIAWSAATRTLSGTLVGAVGTQTAPWQYRMALHAPAGFVVDHAEVDGVGAPAVDQQGEVVKIVFSLPASEEGATVAYRVVFK